MKTLVIYWYNGQRTRIKSRHAAELLPGLAKRKASILFVALDGTIIPNYLLI